MFISSTVSMTRPRQCLKYKHQLVHWRGRKIYFFVELLRLSSCDEKAKSCMLRLFCILDVTESLLNDPRKAFFHTGVKILSRKERKIHSFPCLWCSLREKIHIKAQILSKISKSRGNNVSANTHTQKKKSTNACYDHTHIKMEKMHKNYYKTYWNTWNALWH